MTRPLDLLEALAVEDVAVGPALRHVEVYTMAGLLTVLWHGPPGAQAALVTCGGAMGSLLGPAGGLYHDLATALAARGIATLRVGYRRPNDLDRCTLDVAAAIDLAVRAGVERAVVLGHSFGGAVAVNAAIALPSVVAGVVTLSTQSAGCQQAALLAGRPLLLFHGDADELLPLACSETVRSLAGGGELVVLPGAGHLLREGADVLRERLLEWIPAHLGA